MNIYSVTGTIVTLTITLCYYRWVGSSKPHKINIKSKHFDSPTCLLDGDVTITDPATISNLFNDYFTSIADKILKKREYNGSKSFADFLVNRMTEHFIFTDSDESEIISIISSLETSKSSGPNSIPNRILHLLKNLISKSLSKIYNLSLRTGVHPNILKIAKTIAFSGFIVNYSF